jgi:DNA-binding response OmpR family regulator
MEKVLILENEADIGHLVVFNLRRERYDVTVEHDGREGLGRILKERPDLVTLDLMLPGMNEYQVLKEMQRDPRSYKIPVLMLSARGQLDER